MSKFKKVLLVVSILIVVKLVFFYPSNQKVTTKLEMIENEISKRGYNTNWFVISRKRHRWYNSILSNAAKNSHHLNGDAIDIWVIDIDGNNKFDKKDIQIFKSANDYVENEFPHLRGALGTYTNKGFFTRRMIHIDTRGYKKNYNN